MDRVERRPEGFRERLELRLADHQRGRHLERPSEEETGEQPVAPAGRQNAIAEARLVDEGGDDLDRAQQARRADLTHGGVVGQAAKGVREGGLEVTRVLDEPLVLEKAQVRQSHRTGRGVAGVGVAVTEEAGRAFPEGLRNPRPTDHVAERHVARR